MYKVLVVLIVLVAVSLSTAAEDKYTTKYDGVDLDEILKNERLLQGYCNCLLDKGPCSEDGSALKRVLPEALETDCTKCSEKQREGSRKVLRHLIKNKKDCFDPLEEKYDPKGEYRKRYKDEAAKEGLSL
ncbi:putative insect pheromone-binding family, A10/OS-D [Trypoxylus dichotomus]